MGQYEIEKALQVTPWIGLFNVFESQLFPGMKTISVHKNPVATSTAKPAFSSDLTYDENLLAYDVITYLDSQFHERQKRLNLSVRKVEDAKSSLVNKGLIKEIWLGKSLFLAPTEKLYKIMGLESPYSKRNISDVHSFSVLLAKRLIQENPLVKSVKDEVFLGDSNSTLDLLALMIDGQRQAYEITLSLSNVCANVSKLKNKNFSQIWLVAKDYNTKEGCWALLRNAGFDSDFLSRIHCTMFSTLIKQRKQWKVGK